MTNKKSTKRALLVSAMAMVICFTMLLGTTFAWFTDSETSRNNIIKSGNLDVTFQYSATGADSSWADLTDSTKVFAEENALWEPGYVEVVYLKVDNVGTLDLNYSLGVKIVEETTGTNVNDETLTLSKHIKYAVIPYTGSAPVYADSTAAIAAAEAATGAAAAKALENKYDQDYTLNDDDAAHTYVLIVYMPTNVGNEANYKFGTTVPQIKLGLNVSATQKASESDHYGPNYDAAGSDPADPNA